MIRVLLLYYCVQCLCPGLIFSFLVLTFSNVGRWLKLVHLSHLNVSLSETETEPACRLGREDFNTFYSSWPAAESIS